MGDVLREDGPRGPLGETKAMEFTRAVTGVARVASGCAVALPVARIASVVIGAREPTQLLFPAATEVQAVPVVLGARGFTGVGMAENSIAAKVTSAAAIADRGGVASGSLVVTLQSLGATGLSRLTKLVLGSTGSAAAAAGFVNFL
ncbi:interferon alpha-inducible protein 27, mitochondrial-like [Sapajus apella]|uniref:Interferon alpha-inducible protein 27, mitochondrial-like n=1 Tax=Sapajus apella TaxID=9515 RepID=A0A6J3IMT2_SAPAP|nr:interferon alpha-inducible protein 27, mitochondrial-like [Sapajus apella]